MKCFFSDYPTHWVLFGGRGGVYLRNLTGVTVNVQDNHISLQFTYNTDQIPPQSYNLGPIKTGIDFGLRRNFHFPIDGPSGEVITELEVYMPIKSIYNQVNVHYGFKVSQQNILDFYSFHLTNVEIWYNHEDIHKQRKELFYPYILLLQYRHYDKQTGNSPRNYYRDLHY